MKQWTLLHALMAVLVWASGAGSALASPTGVALVVHVEGEVGFTRGKETWPLRRYDVMSRGDVLNLTPAAQVALVYPGTRQLWTVKGDRRARLRIDSKAPTALDRITLERRDLPFAYGEMKLDAAVFAQAALVLRSEVPQPRFVPRQDALWTTGEVTVEWLPVLSPAAPDAPASAMTYRVQLIDSERAVVDSREVTAPGASWTHLRPGAYLLQVSFTDSQARVRGNTLRFAVATPEQAQRLNAAQPSIDATAAEKAAFDALRLFYSAQP